MSDLPSSGTAAAEVVDGALAGRRSVRGFASEPIAESELSKLFATAQRAPSWCNIQPWRVVVTGPAMTAQVTEALGRAARSGLPGPDLPFPLDYPEPYQTHRRAMGHALYGAMGIERSNKAARYDAWLLNYDLFGAPHLAVVSRHRALGEYATLDVGVWLGMLLTAAAAAGIHTCPLASVAGYPQPLRELLEIPAEEVILFGLALGHEDPKVPANQCRSGREPVSSNVRFVGFDAGVTVAQRKE